MTGKRNNKSNKESASPICRHIAAWSYTGILKGCYQEANVSLVGTISFECEIGNSNDIFLQCLFYGNVKLFTVI